MTDIGKEYRDKLRSPDDVAKAVKSGDWVDYGMGPNFPELLDSALAKRKGELKDVKIRGGLVVAPRIEVVESDRLRETFTYNSWHFGAYERKLHDANLCNYIPMTFRYLPHFYRNHIPVDVAFLTGSVMDEKGYFSVGLTNAATRAIMQKARIVIMEENENYPAARGDGFENTVHISEVDMVVRGEHRPLPELANKEPTREEKEIAKHIVGLIENGSILQFGIGGLPDVVGTMIADSDLKDLGCHTEMLGDAYVKIHRAGKLSNHTKNRHRGKSIWTIALGSRDVYEWIDENDDIWSYPVDYVNATEVIAANDKMVCVNSALEADLYGQVCAESVGTRNISGSGGQLDFLTGAFLSDGGKGFICLTSTYRSTDGEVKSRIVPTMSEGNIVTDPRSQAFYLVTEYGAVNLAGLSTWERAEKIVSIAHPSFRDELIRAADRQKIWRRSNRT
ncbi:MAG: butyryl-CoA:acetate CoA-transferase [Clostridiales Family XIII bacterium]|jgi:butyryl-CoA:acetate CoA-transferase|nr:butyryl-CoA:acetate CoA-transferase [Clostridiales Family XIII bacterium]